MTAAGWDVTAFCSTAEVGAGDEHGLIVLAGSIVGHHSAHIKYPNSTTGTHPVKRWTVDTRYELHMHSTSGPRIAFVITNEIHPTLPHNAFAKARVAVESTA